MQIQIGTSAKIDITKLTSLSKKSSFNIHIKKFYGYFVVENSSLLILKQVK